MERIRADRPSWPGGQWIASDLANELLSQDTNPIIIGNTHPKARFEASAGSCIRARSAIRIRLIHLFKETMERSATPNIGEEKQKCHGREE